MSGTHSDYTVVMPRLGLTMLEATIIEWLKADGDRVDKGELLFTFESDKATLELEAPVGGVLRILVPAGQTVPVQTPVAVLAQSASQPVSTPATPSESLHATPKARALARQRGIDLAGIAGGGPRGMIVSADLVRIPAAEPVNASPVARRVAEQAGLDLAQISGSGPRGQITRADVERFAQDAAPATTLATTPPPAAPGPIPAPTIQGLTGLRAIIAERLTQSWRERPQVTLTTDADATNLVALRQQAIAALGEKISYNALLVWLVARALMQHPALNARLTERGIEQIASVNIGVAVDTERGLLVPVLRDAQALDLLAIHQRLRAAAERAIAGRSLPDDLSGGTFTITNLGMYGIDAFTPIINPPECAILGVGRIVARPVGLNGQIVLREMLALSLAFDHRLVDGAPAARFLARVKELIEYPAALLLAR